MKSKLFPLKALALAALLLGAASAQADITVYTSQAAFNAAVSAPGVDTYDDLSVQLYAPSLLRNAGAYQYTVASTNGLYGAGGPSDFWLSNNTRSDPMTFSGFSSGVNAFGGNFFGSDVSGLFSPGSTMILTASDGTTATYTLENATVGSFVGFVSTVALTSVSLTSAGEYWPTANNVTLAMAAPIPEPETYAMLLVGMGLLGAARRRFR
jgi:hypothetical protein